MPRRVIISSSDYPSYEKQFDVVHTYRFPGMTADVYDAIFTLAKNLAVEETDSTVLEVLVQKFDLDIRDRANVSLWTDEPQIVTRVSFDENKELLRAWVRASQEYSLALDDMDERHVFELYKTATAHIDAKRQNAAERLDSYRFFHRPNADADFAHWCGLPSWSLEEAIALSFGKDPKKVNINSLDDFPTSPFRIRFIDRLDKARRFLPKELTDTVAPQKFIEWGLAQKLELPPAMTEGAVFRKSASDESRLARLENTYLKMILGLALVHYKYDVHNPVGSQVYQDIADHISNYRIPREGKDRRDLRIKVNADTVSKHLKEAVMRLKNKWND